MTARIALAGLAAFVLLAPATASAATARDGAGDAKPKALDITRVEALASTGGVFVQVRLAGNAEKALGRGAKVTVRLGDAVISTRGRSSRAVDRHSGPGGKPIVIRSRRTLTFILDHLDGTKVKRAAVRTSGGDRASVKLAATPRALRCTRSAQLIRKLEGARDALAHEEERLPPRSAHPAPGGAPVREPQPPHGLPAPADPRAACADPTAPGPRSRPGQRRPGRRVHLRARRRDHGNDFGGLAMGVAVHTDMATPPVSCSAPRSRSSATSCRRSRARRSPAWASPSPTPAPTWRGSRPAPFATATST